MKKSLHVWQHVSLVNTTFSFIADINECMKGSICQSNATCQNSIGSYQCVCNPGFIKNGSSCVAMEKCLNYKCPLNATCKDTQSGPKCICRKGFSGNQTHCSDINECDSKTVCSDKNATCVNTAGSFECQCKENYTKSHAHNGSVCIKKDNCGKCHSLANCVKVMGSYKCLCQKGTTGNGTHCSGNLISYLHTNFQVVLLHLWSSRIMRVHTRQGEPV